MCFVFDILLYCITFILIIKDNVHVIKLVSYKHNDEALLPFPFLASPTFKEITWNKQHVNKFI